MSISQKPRAWLILAGLLLSTLFMTGCMANKTRYQPATELAPYEGFRAVKHSIAITPFDIGAAAVTGGHYEGLLQVRQPWIWGLSDAQREALYGDLGNVVRYAFIDELAKRNQRIIISGPGVRSGDAEYTVTGSVRAIELNTYGQGTREGFGSAGNYWEATIELTDVTVVRTSDRAVVWSGGVTQYCKLQDSPAKLTWTMFTLMRKSLENSVALSAGLTPAGVKRMVENTAGEYDLDQTRRTPVEIAARLAAIEVLKHLHGLPGK